MEEMIERIKLLSGDKEILRTIGKQIQFNKEKDVIEKLLISKQTSKNTTVSTSNISLLIDSILSDPDTRERLLDHSVLNDFYFEEKLKERR